MSHLRMPAYQGSPSWFCNNNTILAGPSYDTSGALLKYNPTEVNAFHTAQGTDGISYAAKVIYISSISKNEKETCEEYIIEHTQIRTKLILAIIALSICIIISGIILGYYLYN